jgi:hypothetical protein
MLSGSVYISIHDNAFIGVIYDELVAFRTNDMGEEVTVSFGKATTANFNSIISYIERLKIHAVDWKKQEKTNGTL